MENEVIFKLGMIGIDGYPVTLRFKFHTLESLEKYQAYLKSIGIHTWIIQNIPLKGV